MAAPEYGGGIILINKNSKFFYVHPILINKMCSVKYPSVTVEVHKSDVKQILLRLVSNIDLIIVFSFAYILRTLDFKVFLDTRFISGCTY